MIFAKGVSEEGGRRNRWAAKGFNDGSKEGLDFPANKKKKKKLLFGGNAWRTESNYMWAF